MQKSNLLRRTGIILVGLMFLCHAKSAIAKISPEELKCEYRVEPLGIDAAQPRLSWTLSARERAQMQGAYRILVASSLKSLNKEEPDLWDSGRVLSRNSIHVVYQGKPLKSAQQVFWKVRVWDQDGEVSAWSKPASWTMGMISEQGWAGAKWVSRKTEQRIAMSDCDWIWFPEGDPAVSAPAGRVSFRNTFVLPSERAVKHAQLMISADNEVTVWVNGRKAGASKDWKNPTLLEIIDKLHPGTNVICALALNGGSSPNPAGFIAKLSVDFGGGLNTVLRSDSQWKAFRGEPKGWTGPEFSDSTWKSAKALGKAGMQPWGDVLLPDGALPIFRREFAVNKPIKRALAFICGLGCYELSLNGKRVGDNENDPGWTNYKKRCLYTTYDVTDQIARGDNVIGVMLGNGMYNVTGGRYVKFRGSFGVPQFILKLQLDFADGSSTSVVSGDAWKATTGPITFSCIYGGEDYDARLELCGWNSPRFNDSAWEKAIVQQGPGGKLVSQSAPPIKVMQTFKTVKITEPAPGVFVYDLGQNFSGRPQLTASGPAGSTITMIPGELLDDSGKVTQRSSGGPVSYSYTLKGEGKETWHPRFAYYGFRYVQVEGISQDKKQKDKPVILELEGQFTHSSAEVVGEFECSKTLFNRIHKLINAAIKSNLQSVMTDCPHREKLGWLEVSHLLGPAIMFNYDTPLFYEKIAADMGEAQLGNGMVPDIAPEYTVFSGGFRDSPEWGSASVINQWHLYERFGDRRILEQSYEMMKRYVAYLSSTSKDHIVSHGLGDWYDVGPGGPGESKLTTKGLTATATYYADIVILQKVATLLGKREDAAKYDALAKEVYAAFNKTFLHPESNQYDRASQTANAMPLVYDLVPAERRAAVLENLVQDVRKHDNRVTAGDVGFRYVVTALRDGGRSDVLYDMLSCTNAPSYADQLNKGATTLTEAWDCDKHSSQNHCMLGHAEEWFYSGLAGINPDPEGVGFDKIIIRPEVLGDVTSAHASYKSIRGLIVSQWSRKGKKLTLNITIPANTTATVYVPSSSAGSIRENGKRLAKAAGVSLLREEFGKTVLRVESGTYRFVSNLSN